MASHSNDIERPSARDANLLGALGLAVTDLLPPGGSATAALVTVFNSPGLRIGDLARVLQLSHPGTVRLVDRLVADGFVRRTAAADGRAVALELEPAGRREAVEVLAAREHALDTALARLTHRQRATFTGAVEVLLAALTPDPDVADHTCRLCDERSCPVASCPVECAIAAQR